MLTTGSSFYNELSSLFLNFNCFFRTDIFTGVTAMTSLRIFYNSFGFTKFVDITRTTRKAFTTAGTFFLLIVIFHITVIFT